MALGIAIFLSVVGAILAFAVTAEVSGIDIQTVGVILMIVGVGSLLWSLYRMLSGAERRRQERLGLLPELREAEIEHEIEHERSLVLSREQQERAHALAAEARVFLEAEGYTSERIDELAAEFVAGGIGGTRDEFTAWALSHEHGTRNHEEGPPPLTRGTRPSEDQTRG